MIAIVGATGYTGKLVASELRKRNANFLIAGRNEQSLRSLSESLSGVEYRVVDVENSSTFKALDSCEIIINCAGPFTDFGEPIVQAAIARGAHYLDTTGEQGFIKLVYDKYHEQARAAGIVLIPACAYEYAIGDAMGAQLCHDFPDARALELFYDINEMHTSPGTRKSIVRALSTPGFLFKNSQFVSCAPGAIARKELIEQRLVSIMSFPGGEILMLPRHTNVQDVTTFMIAGAPPAVLKASAAFGKLVMQFTADMIVNRISSAVPSTAQREGSKFLIQAKSKTGTVTHGISVTGNDPYMLTALIICGVAEHLQANPPQQFGATTPAMVGGVGLIRRLLEQSGAKWIASS